MSLQLPQPPPPPPTAYSPPPYMHYSPKSAGSVPSYSPKVNFATYKRVSSQPPPSSLPSSSANFPSFSSPLPADPGCIVRPSAPTPAQSAAADAADEAEAAAAAQADTHLDISTSPKSEGQQSIPGRHGKPMYPVKATKIRPPKIPKNPRIPHDEQAVLNEVQRNVDEIMKAANSIQRPLKDDDLHLMKGTFPCGRCKITFSTLGQAKKHRLTDCAFIPMRAAAGTPTRRKTPGAIGLGAGTSTMATALATGRASLKTMQSVDEAMEMVEPKPMPTLPDRNMNTFDQSILPQRLPPVSSIRIVEPLPPDDELLQPPLTLERPPSYSSGPLSVGESTDGADEDWHGSSLVPVSPSEMPSPRSVSSSSSSTSWSQCPSCGRMLASPSNLKRHQSTCKRYIESQLQPTIGQPPATPYLTPTHAHRSQTLTPPETVVSSPEGHGRSNTTTTSGGIQMTVAQHLIAVSGGDYSTLEKIQPKSVRRTAKKSLSSGSSPNAAAVYVEPMDHVLPKGDCSDHQSTTPTSTAPPTPASTVSTAGTTILETPPPTQGGALTPGQVEADDKVSDTIDRAVLMLHKVASQEVIVKDLTFICFVCDKRFSSRKNVRRHLIAVHKMNPPQTACLTDGVPFTPESNEPESDVQKYLQALERRAQKRKEQLASETISALSLEGLPLEHSSHLAFSHDSCDHSNGSSASSSSQQKDPILSMLEWENSFQCDEKAVMVDGSARLISQSGSTKSTSVSGGGVTLGDYLPVAKKIRLDLSKDDDTAIIVTSRGTRFMVCRSAAMKTSPIFAQLLAHGRECSVEVDPAMFQTLIHVHGDHSFLSAENVDVVSQVARQLRCEQVKALCEKFIEIDLPRTSLLRAIRLADVHNLSRVKDTLCRSINIDIFTNLSKDADYSLMRPSLKAELLEMWGDYL